MIARMPESENPVMPIYLDVHDRTIIDGADDAAAMHEWHPMNIPATRLCKCLEGLRDMEVALSQVSMAEAKDKRRRRLKAVFVPLHSLCVGIVDLINAIQSETSIHQRLPRGCAKELTLLRDRFVTLVPFERKGKLGSLRNKVSAHYERSYSPSQMRDLLQSVTFTEVGEWINISISTICDLLKLDAYMWTACGPVDNTAIVMCQEPIMTVLELDGEKISGIGGIFMRKQSPKWEVFESVKVITRLADSLFDGPSQYRIRTFIEDKPGDCWSKVLRDGLGRSTE